MYESAVSAPLPRLVARGAIGGILMGLANLVPGISGGTMLLAAGVYPEFIGAIADVTRLRFRLRSLAVLASVAGAALVGILLLAGVVKDLVVDHRWMMYSLFIGLTLGGVPIVYRLLGRLDARARSGVAIGFVGMVLLAWWQSSSAAAGAAHDSFPWMLGAGVAGAGAMILPGVSGGYLLLVMGVYIPILSGIDNFKTALEASDLQLVAEPLLSIVMPVGLGMVVGIVGVSNALKWCLDRHKSFTLGMLLGLLMGAVVGLYPFQEGARPEVGDVVKGKILTAENIDDVDSEDWPTKVFVPMGAQVGGSGALVLVGFGITFGIRRLSSSEP